MFTGIIEKVGVVDSVQPGSHSRVVRLKTSFTDLELGESVAVNGVCLTVAALKGEHADFFVSPETLSRTNLGRLKESSRVNLERALTLQTRLSGHFVQGHVDGLARWVSAKDVGESKDIRVELSPAQARYMIEKGSIALNGVSLTVNSITRDAKGGCEIGIMLIPHTWMHTNFSELKPGDPVNVEIDFLAKYVESQLGFRTQESK
jgi:riboflavin synthase